MLVYDNFIKALNKGDLNLEKTLEMSFLINFSSTH